MHQAEVIENRVTQAAKLVDPLLESLTTTFVSCTREINYTSHILLKLILQLCIHVVRSWFKENSNDFLSSKLHVKL